MSADRVADARGDIILVVDGDASRAGRAVRARIDAGERAAGFVGDADDPACAELVNDVLRVPSAGEAARGR